MRLVRQETKRLGIARLSSSRPKKIEEGEEKGAKRRRVRCQRDKKKVIDSVIAHSTMNDGRSLG